jgi:hypothetical protein
VNRGNATSCQTIWGMVAAVDAKRASEPPRSLSSCLFYTHRRQAAGLLARRAFCAARSVCVQKLVSNSNPLPRTHKKHLGIGKKSGRNSECDCGAFSKLFDERERAANAR